jgi:hypothetical protein
LKLGTQPRQRLFVQALPFPLCPLASQHILIVLLLKTAFLIRSERIVLVVLVALSSRLLP